MKKSLKKYFIPNQENDHKPHFLREKSVLVVASIATILLFASVIGSYLVKSTKFLAAIQSAFLVDLANEDRAEQGFGQLTINDKLVLAAQMKANDMAEKSYFAHTSPEGITPWHWFEESEYKYIYAGENLAVNFNRSEDVEEAWMNSPLHRANILNSRYKEIGIATSEGVYKGKNTTFVVQMFGTPSSLNTPTQTNTVTPVASVINTQDTVALNNVTPEVEGESDVNLELVKEANKTEPIKEEKVSQSKQVQTEPQIQEPVIADDGDFVETVNPEFADQDVKGTEDSQARETVVYTNWFERFVVNPGEAVNKAYVILFVVILFSLILKIFVAINKQHPKNIAYGVLLLVLILIFMYINQEMFVTPVVASTF